MELIEFIRTACSSKQVPAKYAEKVQKMFNITEQTAIDEAVVAFKENVLPELEAQQSAIDTAVQTATHKVLEDYEKKHNLKDGKPVEASTPPDVSKLSPEMKALFDAQAKQIETLTNLVGGVVKTQSQAGKLEAVKGKLQDKIDAKFLDNVASKVNLDAEDLDTEIAERVKEFTEMKQLLINEAVSSGQYTPASGVGEADDKDFEDFIKNKENTADENDGFGGVEI